MAGLQASLGRVVAALAAPPGARPGAPGTPAAAALGVTQSAPHVRDAFSLEGAMRWVLVALVPCVLMALYNTGLQANLALAAAGAERAPGWRGAVLDALGSGYELSSVWAAMVHGALYFVPVVLVTVVVGGLWERLFASLRKRPSGEGLAVIALIFALLLPPSIPLWQAALGISFAIVFGREIFGGTGKNFLNPALTGLAFLYVTYPKEMIGQTAWTVIDAFAHPTQLQVATWQAPEAVAWLGTTWMQTFVGVVPGSFGTTSTLACVLGAALLIYRRVASARIMGGVVLGMTGAALALNAFGDPSNPFVEVPWHWHLTLGSFAFGAVFLATDPVSAAMTNDGRALYGLLIGVMIVVLRVADTSHPDGVMFAILLGNILAPLIDYLVVRAHIRRRLRRYG
jgi:Na+-transporting NADH:ubiquinone oxidoreductase subunit B